MVGTLRLYILTIRLNNGDNHSGAHPKTEDTPSKRVHLTLCKGGLEPILC